MKRLLTIMVPLIIMGCSSSMDQERYIRWVEAYDNGLHVKKTINDYVLDVQYKPTDYVALQRVSTTTDLFKDARKAVDNLQYYTLTISTADPENDLLQHGTLAEKQRLLYYFSYELQHAIHLVENGQQRPCQLYHFERSYDLKRGSTFVLGFEKDSLESDEVQMVIDPPLFSATPITITIHKRNIPTLHL